MATQADFKAVRLDRKTEGCRRAIALAWLFLEKRNPDLLTGKGRVFSLLLDMNDLWEKAILGRLRGETRARPGVRVLARRGKVFWRTDEGTAKVVRHDIILELSGRRRKILDTKWKVPKDSVPGDQDLKQIFAYDAMWDTEDGFLIYPRVTSSRDMTGRFGCQIDGRERRCGMSATATDPDDWRSESLSEQLGCSV